MGTTAIPPLESAREMLMMRLFGDLQTVRYNELYYQMRAEFQRKIVTWMNIVAAVASCAALLGILNALPSVSGYKPGVAITGLLTVSAAICAAVGPLLGLEAKAVQLEKAAFGYSVVRDRIRRLLNDLKMEDLNDAHKARDIEIGSLRDALAALDEPGVDKVREQAWTATLKELPSDSAWSIV